jgi:hypothetical protein
MYILRGQRTAIAGKVFSSGGVEAVRAVVGLDVGRLLRARGVSNKPDKQRSVEGTEER